MTPNEQEAGMDWVKLATRYYLDPAVVALPDADTEVLFSRALAYAGDQETGGVITEGATAMLCRRRRYKPCVDALVAAGLWEVVPGGYRITGWTDQALVTEAELKRLARRRGHIPAAVRRAVFERDEGRCTWCGATENLHLDHVHPWVRGGEDTVENLQLLCRTCNLRKGARV